MSVFICRRKSCPAVISPENIFPKLSAMLGRFLPIESVSTFKRGANAVAMMLPDAAAFAFSLSRLSLYAFSSLSADCESISPEASASSPSCFSASAPPSISGLSSCADFPKTCIARLSRSVSFSTVPSAAIRSLKTSSLFRSSPVTSSRTETPSFSNAPVTASLSEVMFFVSLAMLPVIVSTSTSMRSAAYCIFWSCSVESPVCLLIVLRSSAACAASPVIFTIAVPAATAALPYAVSAFVPAWNDLVIACPPIFAAAAAAFPACVATFAKDFATFSTSFATFSGIKSFNFRFFRSFAAFSVSPSFFVVLLSSACVLLSCT